LENNQNQTEMKTSFDVKQFYKELGRLLYAVAIVDGRIQGEEVKALHKFVSHELALSEASSDSSGMNLAFYVDFEFEDYASQKISLQAAYDSFINFLDANIMNIDPVLVKKSVQAIEKVAAAFENTNMQESALIDKIKKDINEKYDLF
jgi:hypothetical protein